jgi:hypothetical protein
MGARRFLAIALLVSAALFAAADGPIRAWAQTKASPIPWRGPLTVDGLDLVRLGMSIADAEKRLGRKFRPKTEFENDSCWMTEILDDTGGPVFMISDGKIVRIEIWAGVLRTDSGIALGSPEQAIRDVYRDRVVATPSAYDPTGFDFRVLGADAKAAMLFETSDGKVVTFRTGLIPMVDYIEQCQ